MDHPPEKLNLSEHYQFQVTIENNGTHFIGDLSLSPTACTLTIRGDISKDRNHTFDIDKIDELTCSSFGATFILLGLSGFGARVQSITRHPTPVNHFEITYRISYVIHSRTIISSDTTYRGIEIESRDFAQWVGYTKTQDVIVEKYNNGTLFQFPSTPHTEVEQPVGNLGILHVAYRPSTHYSVDTFSMGLNFPPVLYLECEREVTAKQAITNVDELTMLFSFLLGRGPNLDTVRLIGTYGRMADITLYFPYNPSQTGATSYAWFPLGINLKFNQLGLPEFPPTSFSTYFELPDFERTYFKKYIKYRETQNPEERFLGFFRLLEKLCFQKETYLSEEKFSNLIKRSTPRLIRHFNDKKNVERIMGRMIDLNESKLNTTSCIARFIKKIPKNLRSAWIYDSSSIENICKLRNDLTHANEIEPEGIDIEQKAKFIEALLVIRLLSMIGISIEDGTRLVSRINRHVLIEKPPKIHYTTLSEK
ncbi:MAG: hypothetical protein GAK33_03001 [Burkholderia lata]|uniref:ApeA N-terminal domain-containing protein n=1 Tax=Burkholderia lata (strain ATCC 17760 / DSM 23089 / LMG 22485 / NCIMB 9086 / R18194 / 383) TaxID=482957 RepID=A0A833PNS1_BURL3|nr:HEPN domain-containing protein [Burkholderia lata]KAF1037648.1 MAG: hypothetical protein GAK33_03001 [Burkholderia lata]